MHHSPTPSKMFASPADANKYYHHYGVPAPRQGEKILPREFNFMETSSTDYAPPMKITAKIK